MNTLNPGEAAQVAADAGAFVEKVASAGNPDSASLARLGKGVGALQLGARLLPAGLRFIKRHPVTGSMAIVALIGGAYWLRTTRAHIREPAQILKGQRLG